MSVIVTGSIAYDYLMLYPGHFREHILMDQVGKISVSFLVEEKQMHRGGVGPNIAYSLALLNGRTGPRSGTNPLPAAGAGGHKEPERHGDRPKLMGTAGRDFGEYREWLEGQGVDTSLVRVYPDEFTATFTAITDVDQNQIAGFHTGAMARARELSFRDFSAAERAEIDLVIISPNDPEAMSRYAAECRELRIPFIYDPSQQLARMEGPEILASMEGALALTVNDYEFELVRNKTGLNEAEILEHVDMLVVTCGAGGATLIARGRRVAVPVAPPAVERDPTGVGDAFRAGLITGLVRGYSWEVTGRLAALAATYVLEQSGTMNHRYTLPEFVARYRSAFGDAPELGDMLRYGGSNA